MKVEYNPSTTTISCTFGNELDLSPKSCSYGICDQEVHIAQNKTTDGSPSTVIIQLNTSSIDPNNCYVVTASNGTFTVMVKGNFQIQLISDSRLSVIIGSVIGVIVGLIAVTIIMVLVYVVYVIMIRRKKCGMYKMYHDGISPYFCLCLYSCTC